jgi:riboflavin transporter FmnP
MDKHFNLTKEMIAGFIIGAVICAAICVFLNYFFIKMPATEAANTFNHSVSGFMSGGISAALGTLITAKKILK